MTDGTGLQTFEIYDIDTKSDPSKGGIAVLGNKKTTTFSEILSVLREKKGVLPRPLIGRPQNGIASIEDRVFGINKNISNLFSKGEFTEDRGTKPNEVTEFLIEFERLEESIIKKDGRYNERLLNCLIELSDIWYQQKVFEFDMKGVDRQNFIYEPADLKRIDIVRDNFKVVLEMLTSQLSELTKSQPDKLTELIRIFSVQKYYIRSILGKNELSERLLKRACRKLAK